VLNIILKFEKKNVEDDKNQPNTCLFKSKNYGHNANSRQTSSTIIHDNKL